MSQRGTLTLFKDIFGPPPAPPREGSYRKGRSTELHERRNECLTDRYYFHARFTEKRYDVILKTLSDEFFLSEVTIPEIIDGNYSQLQQLKREQPNKNIFQKKWPHLVW